MICDVSAFTDSHGSTWGKTSGTSLGCRDNGRRRLESLGHGHGARLHVLEVDSPRDVHRAGILLPFCVHFIDVVGRVALEEGIVRVLQGGVSRHEACHGA